MAAYTSDTPYSGKEKIVVAIDLGTTRSAVSFSYLYPGDNAVVRLVNKWPGQPEASGDSKIPSVLAYQNGKPVACGAEALEYVDDPEYEIAKWFKLHLHPESMKISDLPPSYDNNTTPEIEIPPLPSNTTVKQVYADFLRYLFKTTKEFFQSNIPAGSRIWERLEDADANKNEASLVVILATPNGWDTSQQSFLRDAAIQGGLVSKQDADLRLEYVTEGEASVHYALAHSQSATWLKKGVMFAVTDAGGSTVDSTLYECKETSPKLVLEEVCSSECVQAGGVFVDREARIMLDAKLKNSRFGQEEFLNLMVDEFEKKTKRVYDGTQASSVIHFGRNADNDRAVGIIKGRISLTKEEIGVAYDYVIQRIEESCLKLLSGRKIQFLLLVGGFGESPYLRKRLRDDYGSKGTDVVTVDEPSKKAAAEGATIWYIKNLVVARAARVTFGGIISQNYDDTNVNHRSRKHKTFIDEDGANTIGGLFDSWVEKDTVIPHDLKKTSNYYRPYSKLPSTLGFFSASVYAWEGEDKLIWARNEDGSLVPKLRYVCDLRADLSQLLDSLVVHTGPDGTRFWKVEYQVVVMFGGTRLQAHLQWRENGQLCQGPMSIIPNSVH